MRLCCSILSSKETCRISDVPSLQSQPDELLDPYLCGVTWKGRATSPTHLDTDRLYPWNPVQDLSGFLRALASNAPCQVLKGYLAELVRPDTCTLDLQADSSWPLLFQTALDNACQDPSCQAVACSEGPDRFCGDELCDEIVQPLGIVGFAGARLIDGDTKRGRFLSYRMRGG